jgi:deazaflavin-dependent oxidoreductase (nitroreductase family)
MTTETLTVPNGTPPKWLNAMMKLMLHTPVVQSWIGETIGLITFKGRRTGMSYTTPVTYYREGDTIIVITKKFRNWWRNLAEKPEVEVRLKGQTFRGHARASVGDEAELPVLVKFLENRPLDAKAYRVTLTPEGRIDRDEARALLPQIVLIHITLD